MNEWPAMDSDGREHEEPPTEAGETMAAAIGKNPVLHTLAIMGVVSIFGWGVAPNEPYRVLGVAAPVDEPWWTLFTATYAHLDVAHFTSNAIMVLVAGTIVTLWTSWIRFHLFFIVTGMVTAVVQVHAMLHFGTIVMIIGASGSAFALVGYVLGTVSRAVFSGPINISRKAIILLAVLLASALTIRFSAPGSAYLSHFVGGVIGIFSGWFRLLHTR